MIHFPILKQREAAIFSPIEVFTSLDVAYFKVPLGDRGQKFVLKATIYENDMSPFVFIFYTRIKCEELKKM